MLQPDLHYDGPLTVEYVNELRDKLTEAVNFFDGFEPQMQNDQIDWAACLMNWLNSLNYADHRMFDISSRITTHGLKDEDIEYVNKCVDITLCILRDFEEAKAKNFLRD